MTAAPIAPSINRMAPHPPAATSARAAASADRLDDLARIVAAYNDVTERLQRSHEALHVEVARLQRELAGANAQLLRSKRLAALGEMAAGIAHEIRNPLAAIQLYARMLVEDLTALNTQSCVSATDLSPQVQTAGKIADAVRGLNAVVGDVLSFARELRPCHRWVDLSSLFDRALDQHRPAIEAAGVTIVRDDLRRSDVLVGQVDPELVTQALLNLIRNAVDAMSDPAAPSRQDGAPAASTPLPLGEEPGEGWPRPIADVGDAHAPRERRDPPFLNPSPEGRGTEPARRLTLDARFDDDAIILTVRDTGPGIADSDVDRIFNPFFTTRSTGTGLGLAIVHRIADAHGGTISVFNDGGAVFELRLPRNANGVAPLVAPRVDSFDDSHSQGAGVTSYTSRVA